MRKGIIPRIKYIIDVHENTSPKNIEIKVTKYWFEGLRLRQQTHDIQTSVPENIFRTHRL